MYSISISNFFFNKSNVEYILKFECSGETFLSKYRYSQLKTLDDQLGKTKAEKPQFPKRSLFGKTNQNLSRVQNRQIKLNKYFEQLCLISQTMSCCIIQDFIREAKRNIFDTQDCETLQIQL
ncbi:unnamed protein product [Paramecium sonneborni]|uniref:PX domain-containing protein n=1 Tax=Paramecium sonneborni TaxID=65129 RepID=A0A8S1NA94_9CILI|nr:unnamed protein product [Paramecium sonneborni]